MFHYSLNFSKETAPGKVSLPFCFEADIALPAAQMREEWITALTNPRQSWLWPIAFSVPRVETPPIKQGGFFSLVYQMPDPVNLAAGTTEYTYDYSILRWEPQTLLFQYESALEDGKVHPFSGGGTITITESGDGRSRLKWQGAYHHSGNRQSAEDVFAHYFSLFFTAMAKNIRLNHGLPQ